MARKAQTIDSPTYAVSVETDNAIICQALAILARRVASGPYIDSPAALKQYLTLKFGGLQHEEFGAVFLDSQHRVIATESLFRGTLGQTSVYPREVVKRAISHNAAALVFFHNHPSGSLEPSRADEALTDTLKRALQLVDIRTLDHFIVSPMGCTSFAERGLI